MQGTFDYSHSVVLSVDTQLTIHFVYPCENLLTRRNQSACHSNAYASIRFLNAWYRCWLIVVKLYFSFAHS